VTAASGAPATATGAAPVTAGGGTTPTGPVVTPTSRPWYRRRAFLVTAAIVVIVAVTVVTDLPTRQSGPAQISDDTSVMSQVNSDVAPCSYALGETFEIYGDLKAHTLTPADAAEAPRLLSDDQNACSFTSDSIYELASDIEVPGSTSGKYMGQLVSTVTLWATSDALSAIEQIQTLYSDPTDATALKKLSKDEQLLGHDRAQAQSELAAADEVLHTRLPAIQLSKAPSPR